MRVLVVEDEQKIAEAIADALERAGYVVEIAGDGEQAWFLAETENFDAVILDIGLPKLDGISVVRRLRAAAVATPILIMSARAAWMERVEGIDAGADDYMAKPFQSEELIARLGAIIRRQTGHMTPVLEVGTLRIDTRRMHVTYEGRVINLSHLEFRALRYLMHNRGRVLSQGELADHVYSSRQEPESNALEVLIGRLRKKLDPNVITTRRGYGYIVEG